MELYLVLSAKMRQFRLCIFRVFNVYTFNTYKQGDKGI